MLTSVWWTWRLWGHCCSGPGCLLAVAAVLQPSQGHWPGVLHLRMHWEGVMERAQGLNQYSVAELDPRLPTGPPPTSSISPDYPMGPSETGHLVLLMNGLTDNQHLPHMPGIHVNVKRTNSIELSPDLYSYVVAGMCLYQHAHT